MIPSQWFQTQFLFIFNLLCFSAVRMNKAFSWSSSSQVCVLPPVLIFHSVLLMSTLKFGRGITAGNFVNTHSERWWLICTSPDKVNWAASLHHGHWSGLQPKKQNKSLIPSIIQFCICIRVNSYNTSYFLKINLAFLACWNIAALASQQQKYKPVKPISDILLM